MTSYPRYTSTSAAQAAPSRATEMTVNESRACILAEIWRKEFDRGMTAIWERNRRQVRRVPVGILSALPELEPSPFGREKSTCSHENDLEEPHNDRSYATMAATAGEGQSRGTAV